MERITKEYICQICGDTFSTRGCNSPKYCSRACKYKAARAKLMEKRKPIMRNCPHCGKEFERIYRNQKFCCRVCRDAEYIPPEVVSNGNQGRRYSVDDPHEALAIAIITQAATDYKRVFRRLLLHPRDRKALKCKTELEEFFESEWYSSLTSLPAEIILNKIRAEVSA